MSACKTLVKRLSIYAAMFLGPGSVLADYGLNMTESVTPVGREIYDLHMLILWIVTIVGIAVFAVMIWSIFHHRKSKGAVAAQFHESTTVEIIWTIIPFVILVVIAVPATKTLLSIENTGNPDVDIKVTAWQWKWQYEYLNEGVSFFSVLDAKSNEVRQLNSGKDPREVENYLLNVDKPLVVPINKKIRFLMTSNDVIHAWWVPDLAVKRDAIPGFINESWAVIEKEGTYRGQCAELCGKDHGYMPIVVKAVSEKKYKTWIAQQKKQGGEDMAKVWTKQDLMARGEKVYTASCAACHQLNGAGIPGVFPGLVGSPIATGPLNAHLNIVLKGKSGTAMQPFGAQLNNTDLAAVITYERNAWGINTGNVVQPSDVKAAR